MQTALTIQNNPNYLPGGSRRSSTRDAEFQRRRQHDRPYIFKAQGSYTVPVGHHRVGQLQHERGRDADADHQRTGRGLRRVSARPGATTISYNTLEFQARDGYRFDPVKLLDLGVQKVFKFRGGRTASS